MHSVAITVNGVQYPMAEATIGECGKCVLNPLHCHLICHRVRMEERRRRKNY